MRSSDDYRAYLVRLWREGKDLAWRVTLEDAHTGARIGFASLRRLFEFLEAQTGEHAGVLDSEQTTTRE